MCMHKQQTVKHPEQKVTGLKRKNKQIHNYNGKFPLQSLRNKYNKWTNRVSRLNIRRIYKN